MIGQQGPGIDLDSRLRDKTIQTGEESLLVFIIIKDSSLLNPPDNDVVKRTRGIQSRLSGHNYPPITTYRKTQFAIVSWGFSAISEVQFREA